MHYVGDSCSPPHTPQEIFNGLIDAQYAKAKRDPTSPHYSPTRKNDDPEARVNQAVREWLTLHRIFFFRVNTMGTPLPGGGYRPASTKGISDYIAIINGTFVALESKSDVGRQSQDQIAFEEAVKKAGGFYFLIRGVEDLERHVKPLLK